MFQRIDLEKWDRKAAFEEFMELDCSYALTRTLCVTGFYRFVKRNGLRFYPAFVWAVLTAVNRHKEFRMGFDKEGNPGYYAYVNAEYTVLNRRTRNMESLNTEYNVDFRVFYRMMKEDLERFEQEGVRTGTRENSILFSCVPWFSYTGLSFHMKSNMSFLRPMFVWGKYERRDGEVFLPFTIQAHHAAADGYHCHLLFEELDGILRELWEDETLA